MKNKLTSIYISVALMSIFVLYLCFSAANLYGYSPLVKFLFAVMCGIAWPISWFIVLTHA